jgi:hypothetical protein
MSWAVHAACMGNREMHAKFLLEILEGRGRLEDHTGGILCEGVESLQLDGDMVQ